MYHSDSKISNFKKQFNELKIFSAPLTYQTFTLQNDNKVFAKVKGWYKKLLEKNTDQHLLLTVLTAGLEGRPILPVGAGGLFDSFKFVGCPGIVRIVPGGHIGIQEGSAEDEAGLFEIR